jgi:hypothetical protein
MRVGVDYWDSPYLYQLDLSLLWRGIVLEDRAQTQAQAHTPDDDFSSL